MAGEPTTSRVLFIRHPETLGNTRHFFSGRLDVDLTPEGEAQRDRAIQALVAWEPDRVYTSPLKRCRAIAEPVAEKLGVPLVVDDRLIEIDFGVIESKTSEEAAQMGLAFPWPIVDGRSVPCEGGESYEHIIERARGFIEHAVTLVGKTACVTHGGFTRAIFAAAYGEDVDRFWFRVVPNVSSQVFVSKGGRLRLQSCGISPEELEMRANHHFVPSDHNATYERLCDNYADN